MSGASQLTRFIISIIYGIELKYNLYNIIIKISISKTATGLYLTIFFDLAPTLLLLLFCQVNCRVNNFQVNFNLIRKCNTETLLLLLPQPTGGFLYSEAIFEFLVVPEIS